MKRILFALLAFALIFFTVGCNDSLWENDSSDDTENPSDENSSPGGDTDNGTSPDTSTPAYTGSEKILVAYFSATGTTKSVAEKIANVTNADLFEIVPSLPYTTEDLNYSDKNSRSSQEMNDPSCRPGISNQVDQFSGYDIIFIGYPIWWGEAPRIMSTFVESYDFSGKTVVPFCTSGSSSIGQSAVNLKSLCAENSVWLAGKRFSGNTDMDDIASWIDQLQLKTGENAVYVYCGNRVLKMELADNASATAFAEKLKSGDITLTMNDYGNFEKVGELGFSLPQTNEQITTVPGDVILYLGTSITVYYDTNSWNFTRIGNIPGMTRESMLEFFGGTGEVTVRFSLNQEG